MEEEVRNMKNMKLKDVVEVIAHNFYEDAIDQSAETVGEVFRNHMYDAEDIKSEVMFSLTVDFDETQLKLDEDGTVHLKDGAVVPYSKIVSELKAYRF